MNTYLINYEAQTEVTQKILDTLIKNLGESMQITETLWALKTEISAKELRNSLREHLQINDRLMVVKSGREAAWHNSLCPNGWIAENF